MKVPTKGQLYDRIAELEKINEKAVEEAERSRVTRWKELIPAACGTCSKKLYETFPNMVRLLKFEHVDAGGFWFTFQLENDPRRQTYVVRHEEV